MANSVLCVKWGEMDPWKMRESKDGEWRLGRDFVCGRCKKQVYDRLVEPVEELCEEVETVSERFLLFGG